MSARKKEEKVGIGQKILNYCANPWVRVALVVLCFLTMLGARMYVDHPITGDEPHYLLMSRSMIKDHDLNLKNNYLNNDSADFYPGLSQYLQVGPGQGTQASNRWYSIHEIGLPVLLIPGMYIGAKTGAVVMMLIFATTTIVLTWVWVSIITKNELYAYISALGLLICFSFAGLAGYIYPDIVMAGMTLLALIIIEKYHDKRLALILFGLVVGYLPLLHFKGALIAAPLFLALIYKTWTKSKRLPWETLIFTIPMVAYFFLSNHGWFGVWNPMLIYQALHIPYVNPVMISAGLLFDSMRGFIIYSPLIVLLFAGLPIWYRRSRTTFFISLAVVLPSAIALATFGAWQGGDSQIGRYILDFVPVLFPAIGFSLIAFKKRWQRIVIACLFALSLAITLQAVITRRSYVRDSVRSPLFARIDELTGVSIDRLLPTFDPNTRLMYGHDKYKVIIGYVAVAGLVAYGYKIGRNELKDSRTTRKS